MQNIGIIISSYRKKAGYSQSELAELLAEYGYSLSNKAISRWEKGFNEPSFGVLMTLCKILGITDIYSEYYGINPDNPFAQLNDIGRKKAIEYIELLSENSRYAKAASNIMPFKALRKIKLFSTLVSAGTGNFLDSEDYELIEVDDTVPSNADYGLRITGDSMEPLYSNGQTVWIHSQNTLDNNETGIFFYDGKAYIKNFSNSKDGLFLISINKAYSPIRIIEEKNFCILGKVIE